jgi:hypothetical protein
METNARGRRIRKRIELPTIQDQLGCTFVGYDARSLMAETAKLRKLIMKRGKFFSSILIYFVQSLTFFLILQIFSKYFHPE